MRFFECTIKKIEYNVVTLTDKIDEMRHVIVEVETTEGLDLNEVLGEMLFQQLNAMNPGFTILSVAFEYFEVEPNTSGDGFYVRK